MDEYVKNKLDARAAKQAVDAAALEKRNEQANATREKLREKYRAGETSIRAFEANITSRDSGGEIKITSEETLTEDVLSGIEVKLSSMGKSLLMNASVNPVSGFLDLSYKNPYNGGKAHFTVNPARGGELEARAEQFWKMSVDFLIPV